MNVAFAAIMLAAFAMDVAIGWPARLFAAIGHPVTWLGRLIGFLDARWNRASHRPGIRRAAGATTLLVVTAVATMPAFAVQRALPEGWGAVLLGCLFAWPLIASRSLHDHVVAVSRPLAAGNIEHARQAVAQIVGRDPAGLDQAGVSRAALESLAESTSDGVVAPILWGVVLGLPGIAAYKAINTLDSMIGHRTPRHQDFGMAAARIDDLANLIPARLTGVLFALVSSQPANSLRVMLADARHHRSPNAGWPEAAMAGALGVRLSGPRIYSGQAVNEPWLNGGAQDPESEALKRGLSLYQRAMMLLAALLGLLVVL